MKADTFRTNYDTILTIRLFFPGSKTGHAGFYFSDYGYFCVLRPSLFIGLRIKKEFSKYLWREKSLRRI